MIKINNLNVKYFEELLNEKIKDAYIQKIQNIDNALKIRFKKKENIDLIKSKDYFFITKFNFEAEEKKEFTKTLEKILKKKKVLNIKQINLEKIIVFEFDEYFLIFELFSHCNTILCDKNYKIIKANFNEKWKDRIIKEKEFYKFPKNNKENPLKIKNANSLEELIKKINASPEMIKYIFENEKDLEKTIKKIKDIYSKSVLKNKIKKVKDEYFNFCYKDCIEKSYNDILEQCYVEEIREKIKKSKKEIKLEISIKKIEKSIKEFDRKSEEYKKIAELIKKNINNIEFIRKEIIKAIEKKIPEREINKKIKEMQKNYEFLKYIKKVDLKRKKIIFTSLPHDQQ